MEFGYRSEDMLQLDVDQCGGNPSSELSHLGMEKVMNKTLR